MFFFLVLVRVCVYMCVLHFDCPLLALFYQWSSTLNLFDENKCAFRRFIFNVSTRWQCDKMMSTLIKISRTISLFTIDKETRNRLPATLVNMITSNAFSSMPTRFSSLVQITNVRAFYSCRYVSFYFILFIYLFISGHDKMRLSPSRFWPDTKCNIMVIWELLSEFHRMCIFHFFLLM